MRPLPASQQTPPAFLQTDLRALSLYSDPPPMHPDASRPLPPEQTYIIAPRHPNARPRFRRYHNFKIYATSPHNFPSHFAYSSSTIPTSCTPVFNVRRLFPSKAYEIRHNHRSLLRITPVFSSLWSRPTAWQLHNLGLYDDIQPGKHIGTLNLALPGLSIFLSEHPFSIPRLEILRYEEDHMEYEHGNISYMSSSMSHSASSEASRIEGGNKMEDCGIIRHRMRLSVGDTTCGDTANVIGDVRRVLMPQTQAGLKDHYVLHVTLSHCSREEACLWLALLLTTSEKTIKKRGGEQGENGTLIRPRSIGI